MRYYFVKILGFFLVGTLVMGCAPEKKSLFEGSGDIGDCKFPGSVQYDASLDRYTLEAAGLNLWEEKDAFFMVWNEVSGDFSLSADIAFEGEGVNAHRKMGLMIREKLTPGSRYADVAVHGDGLTSLQYRESEDGVTAELVSVNVAPDKIYLERKGSTISIKTGVGSLGKTPDASLDLSLPENCYVGLFLCSHEDSVVEKAYFSQVVFQKL